MTQSRRQKLRSIAFHEQDRLCFYCELPIWEDAAEQFASAHGLTAAQANLLKSTAEHLVAQRDGGRDTPDNIVAACAWCNSRRHAGRSHRAPEPQAYKCRIAQRIAIDKWHPAGLAAVFKRDQPAHNMRPKKLGC